MRGKVFGTLGFRYLGGSGTQGVEYLEGGRLPGGRL